MGTLSKIAKGMKPADVAVHDDPIKELRLRVRQHRAVHKEWQRADAAAKEYRTFADGKKVKSSLPDDYRNNVAAPARDAAAAFKVDLKRKIEVELKKVPIYQVHLSKVAGMGPILAAYLVAIVDIHRATKPSNLKRFCGAAKDEVTGLLEKPRALTKDEIAENKLRRARGDKPIPGRHYCADIRVQLYLWQGQISKEGRDKDDGVVRPCKYLTAWEDYKNTIRTTDPDRVKGSERRGAWRMANIMLDDLYTVWRALEGLPVWPDWHAERMGYRHGGKIKVDGPKALTVEEAQEIVGDCGWQCDRVRPPAQPLPDEWRPNEESVALSDDLGLDVGAEVDSMRRWAHRGNKPTRRADWDKQLCRRMRDAAEVSKQPESGVGLIDDPAAEYEAVKGIAV